MIKNIIPGLVAILTLSGFTSQVTFGDSLSDVGTYAVGTIKALHGGKYTVNSLTPSAQNWTEFMALELGLPAPCPAQTGLSGDATKGFNVPVVNHPHCYGYAQGGARISNPVGPSNARTGSPLGGLTVPVITQIHNHLAAVGNRFDGSEIVFVMAGGNDLLTQLAATPLDPTVAIEAMRLAGQELTEAIQTLILDRGAKYVVLINLPNLNVTPFWKILSVAQKNLVGEMTTTFNAQLEARLSFHPDVLYVEPETLLINEIAHPELYDLTNTSQLACDLTKAKNPLGSSLICTPENLIPGADEHYLFADTLHLTAHGYQLFSEFILQQIAAKGWK